MNARKAFGMTATMIALSGMAACGTHHADGTGSPSHPQSPSSSSSSSSSGSTTSPLVIKLNAANGTYKMAVGQKLVVQVSAGTKIQPSQKSCSGGKGGALKQLCTSGSNYEYQAVHSGMAQFSYTIRPDCKAGAACPAWIRNASFEVSVG